MSVYFVYRCPYIAPAGKHFKRFDDDTVLDWFRHYWNQPGPGENAYDRVDELLGCDVYSFGHLFRVVAEESLPAPKNAAALRGRVASETYSNTVLCDSTHLLQVETDDDEVGLAYYFFDDHFLKKYPKRVAWLAREDWRLPDGCGTGGFRPTEPTHRSPPSAPWQGTTFVVELDHVGDMSDLCPAYRIDGVRLPDLARHLMRYTLDTGDCAGPLLWMRDMIAIEPFGCEPLERSFVQALRDNPDDQAAWNAYSDWLQERGERSAGAHLLHRALIRLGLYEDDTWRKYPKRPKKLAETDTWAADIRTAARIMRPVAEAADRQATSSRSLVHAGEHVAQLALHDHYWKPLNHHTYHHWILFDDLWASALPDLANAILRYVRRWDVLSPLRSPPPTET